MTSRSQHPKSRVTIVEVARSAGVAVSTVSRVLNGGYASADVRARVRQVVAELGFVPSTSARGLKLGRTNLVGFVSWNTQGAWVTGLLGGLEDELVGRSMSTVVASVGRSGSFDCSAVRSWIGERRVDGVVVARAPCEYREMFDLLGAANIPTVIVSPDMDFGVGVCITADNRAAGRTAGEHLLSLGHRHIAYIGGPSDSVDACDRREGLRDAMNSAGLSLSPHSVEFAPSYHPDTAIAFAENWLEQPQRERSTAVVLGNDEMAIQFMRVVLHRGVSIPGEVSVVGFDGIPEGSRCWPGLTTVAQPLRAMGSTACRMLLRMVEDSDEKVPERVAFGVELIQRESSGPVPTQ